MASSVFSGSGYKWRTNFLLFCIATLATYMFFDVHSPDPYSDDDYDNIVDMAELEQEVDSGNPVRIVSYKSPLNEDLLFRPRKQAAAPPPPAIRPYLEESTADRAARYHAIWDKADRMISNRQLWKESPAAEEVIRALATARIVSVDVLDIGEYESGTADKWVVTLEGGQKAAVKVVWEEKGQMKRGAMCNYGFEMPTSEIAAFHLHRVLGFYNTPFVTGRKLDLLHEVLPVASSAVAKDIIVKPGNDTCLQGTCFYCKVKHTMCPRDGIIEVSMSYWIPRRLKLYTYPVKYMPYSTPRMDEWGDLDFNDHTYCDKVRQSIEPYNKDRYYYDLFDFSVLDTLMYHYDSKHYSINDNSKARGLTVRLDHGRAFCAHDRDEEKVFLAPVKQCCTVRRSTYESLKGVRGGLLTKRLRESLSKDPIAPILDPVWYQALQRRLKIILDMIERCISANGADSVLIDEDDSF